MKIGGIVYESIVDGKGIRNVIFISGCKHHCHGCHNRKLWDFNYGEDFSLELQKKFIKDCKDNPLLDGITISGGDPMFSAEELIEFIKLYKEENPEHTIWIYSGFTYWEILKNNNMKKLLMMCDFLVDGRYVEKQKNELPFRGSDNQRIIKIK